MKLSVCVRARMRVCFSNNNQKGHMKIAEITGSIEAEISQRTEEVNWQSPFSVSLRQTHRSRLSSTRRQMCVCAFVCVFDPKIQFLSSSLTALLNEDIFH